MIMMIAGMRDRTSGIGAAMKMRKLRGRMAVGGDGRG
jgi:hypothetical protein